MPFRRSPDVAFRILDGQGVVAVPGRSEVHVLNPVGTRVFELLDGQRDEEQIARTIEEEFDVTVDKAKADVREFLEDLVRKGMVA